MTVPLVNNTPVSPRASAARTIAPAWPGSCNPSSTIARVCPRSASSSFQLRGTASAMTPWLDSVPASLWNTASSTTTSRTAGRRFARSRTTERTDSAARIIFTSSSLRSASSNRWNVSATRYPCEVSPPRAMARLRSFSSGLDGLVNMRVQYARIRIPQMRSLLRKASLLCVLAVTGYLVFVSIQIGRQSSRDEARPADVILILGAAEYRGRPSPVLKARLDHALDLYEKKMAPILITTGGAGGDPDYTEGGVGRSYLIEHDVPSEAIIVEPEGETTAHSLAPPR